MGGLVGVDFVRENIFEILKRNTSGFSNVDRLQRLFEDEDILKIHFGDSSSQRLSLSQFVDLYCFDNWKNKGYCCDFYDYLEAVCYEDLLRDSSNRSTESLLTLIELLYNCWLLPQWIYDDGIEYLESGLLLKNIMDSTLADFNHRIYEDAENERALVIEDKPGVTAVAEIIKSELSFDVIRYNHYALKGNIAEKKSILHRFIDDLEAKRPQLSKLAPKFTSDLFELFNSLNIRHNNIDPAGKKYIPYVAKMSQEELENWYDELYQMVLLAYLMLDHVERAEKVKDLRNKLHSKNS